MAKRMAVPATVNISMTLKEVHVTVLRSPMDHWKTADRVCSLTESLMRVVIALNRYITAIPARIIVAAEVFLSDDTSMMTAAGISGGHETYRAPDAGHGNPHSERKGGTE